MFGPTSLMTSFFKNPGGDRIIVEGEPGVGKTTFVNSFRYKWLNNKNTKLYTTLRYIEFQDHWTSKNVLISTIHTLVNRIVQDENLRLNDYTLLLEISTAVGVTLHEKKGGGISLGGFGGQFQNSNEVSAINLTNEQLHSFLLALTEFIMGFGYKGIIIHYENLDRISREKLYKLIDDSRDYFLTPNIYFIFVGGPGTFRDIILSNERVESVFFDRPITLKPLSQDEIFKLIKKRCDAAAFKKNEWYLPINEELIVTLYEIFEGKIRSIMNEIKNLISVLNPGTSINNERAIEILKQRKLALLQTFQMPESSIKFFIEAIKLKEFTLSSLEKHIPASKQNIEQNHLKHWLRNKMITGPRKEGRKKIYKVSAAYLLLGY